MYDYVWSLRKIAYVSVLQLRTIDRILDTARRYAGDMTLSHVISGAEFRDRLTAWLEDLVIFIHATAFIHVRLY